jgi:hypothetical protein
MSTICERGRVKNSGRLGCGWESPERAGLLEPPAKHSVEGEAVDSINAKLKWGIFSAIF